MSIRQYLKEIGRGKQGARPLSREQAADLFGQVLDGTVSDLEVGAFCLAMRIKGETPQEMCGFLDATAARLNHVPASSSPIVVLPSYNGARKLPLLTPLLALLVARRGVAVLIHGTVTEPARVSVRPVLQAIGIEPLPGVRPLAPGEAVFLETEFLSPGLKRLLDARLVIGLRNSAHSLVKLMNPSAGPAVIVSSYTHPEYGASMAAVFEMMGSTALLSRGTEGEVVADPRRLPQMDGFVAGRRVTLQQGQRGTLTSPPEFPADTDAERTAGYIQDVLAGRQPVPASLALQVEHISHLVRAASPT